MATTGIRMAQTPHVPTSMTVTQKSDSPEDFRSRDPHGVDGLAELVIDRMNNRVDDRYDAVLFLESWAVNPEYDISTSRVVLAGAVHDYSEKAVRIEGGFTVNIAKLPSYDYMTEVVNKFEPEGDYENVYVPKSAIEMIVQPTDDFADTDEQ